MQDREFHKKKAKQVSLVDYDYGIKSTTIYKLGLMPNQTITIKEITNTISFTTNAS